MRPARWSISTSHQAAEEPSWVANVRIWRAAVEDHKPGKIDDAVIGINAWSYRDLAATVADLVGLRDLLVKLRTGPGPSFRLPKYANHTFSASEVEAILGVTPEEGAPREVNRLLERGAILHTDIALLAAIETVPYGAPEAAMRGRDGRAGGVVATVHWEIARRLLDAVTPAPSADPFVRSWYRATTALLQHDYDLAYARPQLEHGLAILPNDAALLFGSGCLHEAHASPLVQSMVRSAGTTVSLNVGSPTSHLRLAERYFREALAVDPAMTQARLRLGRVLGLLGRHDEAIAELQRAVQASGDRQMLYYGEMFLGAEKRALGLDEDARAHYERAAGICPSAPSPQIALSDLGQRAGNRPAALGAIQRAFASAADRQSPGDPWWVYSIAPFANAEDLLDACRRHVQGGTKR